MLGVACERAGIEFEIFDRGHDRAASRVGAGLVSPLTGRRLVPTWRFVEWRDQVLEIYRELEAELSQPFVREMKIRRLFRDSAQRKSFEERCGKPEVAAWVSERDSEGLWMHGAIQVETGKLIAALRERWSSQGRLSHKVVEFDELSGGGPTVWCVGAEIAELLPITWQPSRGEIVRGRLAGLDRETVLNDGHWLLPLASGEVRVGSTFDRLDLQLHTTDAHQSELREAAQRLGGQSLQDARGDMGLRVTVPDHRPVVGWCDNDHRCGVFVGLAAKGALWAPVLAQHWVADQLEGKLIDPEARVGRFAV